MREQVVHFIASVLASPACGADTFLGELAWTENVADTTCKACRRTVAWKQALKAKTKVAQ